MKKTLLTTALLALSSTAFAETMRAQSEYETPGSIQRDGEYVVTWITGKDTNTTVKYDTITSGGVVRIRPVLSGNSTFSVEVDSIKTQGNIVYINTSAGDITLGDVEAACIQAVTNNGNVRITGTLDITDTDGAFIMAAPNGGEGSIVIDNATVKNVSIETNLETGTIEISGDVSLADVYFQATTVAIADGASLTLDNVIFADRGNYTQGLVTEAVTGLELGDNSTLTLSGNQPLEVASLSIGSGVSFVVELSDEVFENLDNTEINLFSIVGEEEDEIDLAGAKFTFTNAAGTEAKSGTITAGNGGSITVTNSYTVAIPEPTTATLSLLALAGLAMRRRRK